MAAGELTFQRRREDAKDNADRVAEDALERIKRAEERIRHTTRLSRMNRIYQERQDGKVQSE